MPFTVTIEGDGLTADHLLWNAYGRRGNTSPMLDLFLATNPGLADLGAVIPPGTSVVVPDLPAPIRTRPKRAAVDLFGD